jgi:hypothetical protein
VSYATSSWSLGEGGGVGGGVGGGDAVGHIILGSGGDLRLAPLRSTSVVGKVVTVEIAGARIPTIGGDRIWTLTHNLDAAHRCGDVYSQGDAAVSVGFERSGAAHRVFDYDSHSAGAVASVATETSDGSDSDADVVLQGPASAIAHVKLAGR